MIQPATYFDGETAIENPVLVKVTDARLLLELSDGAEEVVDASKLVKLYALPNQVRLGRKDLSGWRLIIEGEPDPAVAALLPPRIGSLTPSVSRKAALVGFASSSLIIGMIASLFIAPQVAAQQMPLRLERRVGESVKFANYIPRCENPEAIAALGKIVDRLDPKARADGFTTEILGIGEVNAAALPGGRIVVLKGLIDEAGNADVVAGVLAHEIAHVRRRHVASAAIRQLGVASLVSLLGGASLTAAGGNLLALKFGRDAEDEADADAIAMLKRAEINPKPTAFMFERIDKSEGKEAFAWLASHPSSEGRAKAFARSYEGHTRYRPTLTVEQEDALFDACRWPYVHYGEEAKTT